MSLIQDPSSFDAITTFEGQDAVVALCGKVENLAASELSAALNATIDRHPTSVVLDLTELDFMGAAGMVAVADAEKRLATEGIKLTVRSPSALVSDLLAMLETAEETRLEVELPEHDHLGPEQQGRAPVVSQRVGSSMAADDLRRLTAMPADPDVVDGALRLIVELARTSVVGADGVSISLQRHGRLSTVAASDQTILAMDADQYSTGEGPCVDASLKGHWFHAESLATETRWPAFTPKAQELGIKAIMSSPLTSLDRPVGALNIYSRTASTFEIRDQEAAAGFAAKASAILSDAQVGVSDTQMAMRFQEALRSRDVVALAKGVIMEREGIDEDEAFTALLRLSLEHGEALRESAAATVRSVVQAEIVRSVPND